MSFNILVLSDAVKDIQSAFQWYEQQRPGLGYALLEEIETCFEKLSRNPENYSYINSTYRRIKTNRFPYLIVYEVNATNIIVNSVRHSKRKPR